MPSINASFTLYKWNIWYQKAVIVFYPLDASPMPNTPSAGLNKVSKNDVYHIMVPYTDKPITPTEKTVCFVWLLEMDLKK